MPSKVTIAFASASAALILLGTLALFKAASLARIADWQVVVPVVLSDDGHMKVPFRVKSDGRYVADLDVDRLLPQAEIERLLCLGWGPQSGPSGVIIAWQLRSEGEIAAEGKTPCNGWSEGYQEKVGKPLAQFSLAAEKTSLLIVHFDQFDPKLLTLHPRIAIRLEPLEHKAFVTNALGLRTVGVALSIVGIIGAVFVARSWRRRDDAR